MTGIDERYKRGKIYTVRCRYDKNLIYVGSTIQPLSKRMGGHREDTKCSLYKLVDGDWDNWYIELYEEYPCNNKQILEKREGEIQREISTINNYIAGRTKKEYEQDNRDKISEQKKQYYKDNRDKIAEYKKQYHQDNRDKILEKLKQYHQDNRDKNLERMKEKTICERCGFISAKNHLTRHQKSEKCLNYNVSNS